MEIVIIINKTGRVLSTECSLCQTCITVCAQDALKLSFGFDLGGKELLRERRSRVCAGSKPTISIKVVQTRSRR
jgi:formate hydrogenlyase subunit 6/NADH:ubiquinone oxidoreductase subunit I